MKTNEVILQMHPLSCHLALLLRRAPPGSLGSVAGWGLWGERWLSWTFHQDSPRAFFGLTKAWSLEILFVSRYCWMILFVFWVCFFHNEKIGTKMTHIQILLNMSTHRPLCFILQALNQLWIMCASYMAQLYLTSFSSIQTQSHCSSSFPTWSHSTHRRIQALGPTPPTPSSQVARRRPCTAELWQGTKRTSVRITRWPPWTTWRAFWKSRGSWLRPGWGLPGERWPSWRTFHQGHFFVWPRPGFVLFNFPVLLGHLFWAN